MKTNNRTILITAAALLVSLAPVSADNTKHEGFRFMKLFVTQGVYLGYNYISTYKDLKCTSEYTNEKIHSARYKAPTEKQILLVGKILLKNDINRDFYMKTFKIAQDNGDYVFMPTVLMPYTIVTEGENTGSHTYQDFRVSDITKASKYPNLFRLGEYFFLLIPRPENPLVELNEAQVLLFGNEKTVIHIPLPNVAVAKDVRYAYIGTMMYEFKGDTFVTKNVVIDDNMEEASKALDLFDKDHDPLTRCEATFEWVTADKKDTKAKETK